MDLRSGATAILCVPAWGEHRFRRLLRRSMTQDDSDTASKSRQTNWYRGLWLRAITPSRSSACVELPALTGFFLGFRRGVDGRWLLCAITTRQIEFIRIPVRAATRSVGYGGIALTTNSRRSDASQSYAIVAAPQLHADWQLNAMDGIGVVRNLHGHLEGHQLCTYASLTLQADSSSRYRTWIGIRRGGRTDGSNDFAAPWSG